jgi:hypothetical protein
MRRDETRKSRKRKLDRWSKGRRSVGASEEKRRRKEGEKGKTKNKF